MDRELGSFAVLLLLSAIVALITRRWRIPYSAGLVVAGGVLWFSHALPVIPLSKELLFLVLLPPLIFEAAFYIRWTNLRTDLPVVLTLATAGVLLAGLIVAAGMHYLVGWVWTSALAFGFLIAATDPVSVIAAFKEAGVRGRLRLLVEAESLVNDGTAAVAFGLVVAVAQGIAPTPQEALLSLASTLAGGILSGLIVAAIALFLARKTDDHLVEITSTTVAAYGSFLLAERFHCSGILATMSAGLLIGHYSSLGTITDKGRESVGAFWEYAAFVANSLIFLLIGSRLAEQSFAPVAWAAIAAILLVCFGRAVAVYAGCAVWIRSAHKVDPGYQHILVWGGLRGALALALALGLPGAIPHRNEVVAVTYAVVAFSVFVQGLTMPPFLRRLGYIR